MTRQQPPRDDVDTRIDLYLNAHEPADDADQPLVQRLGAYYQLPEGHDLALKRVQMRLERAQNPLLEEAGAQSAQIVASPGQFKASALKIPHLEARRRFSRRLSLLAAVALVALLLSGALVVLRQGQSQTVVTGHGLKPSKTQTRVPQSQPARLYTLGGQIGSPSSPGQRVLVQLDPDSGQVLWQFPIKFENTGNGHRSSCFSGPTTAGDLLYFESSDTHGTTLYALNVTNGALRWKALIGGVCEKQVVADGRIFVAQSTAGNDRVLAFNALNGQAIWYLNSPGSGNDYVSDIEVVGVRQNILYVDRLSFAQQKVVIYALDTRTGVPIWQQTISHIISITSTATAGNLLYLAGAASTANTPQSPSSLVAFDLAAGKQLWATHVTGSVHQLVVSNQNIYASTLNKDHYGEMVAGSVYALNASNGTLIWQQQPGQEIMGMQVANGVMYLALADPGGGIYSSSARDKNGKYRIVVTGPAWHLEALQASNGQRIWQQTLPASVEGSLLVYHAHLYLVDVNKATIDILDVSSGRQVKTLPLSDSSDWMMGIELFLA